MCISDGDVIAVSIVLCIILLFYCPLRTDRKLWFKFIKVSNSQGSQNKQLLLAVCPIYELFNFTVKLSVHMSYVTTFLWCVFVTRNTLEFLWVRWEWEFQAASWFRFWPIFTIRSISRITPLQFYYFIVNIILIWYSGEFLKGS